MSKSQAKLSDVEKLELVSQKAARSLDLIVKTIEKASELKPEEVEAVFTNLSQLLLTAHQKARLSLTIALKTNGAPKMTLVTADTPSITASAMREALVRPPRGERIAKGSPDYVASDQASRPRAEDDDDIGFIED